MAPRRAGDLQQAPQGALAGKQACLPGVTESRVPHGVPGSSLQRGLSSLSVPSSVLVSREPRDL